MGCRLWGRKGLDTTEVTAAAAAAQGSPALANHWLLPEPGVFREERGLDPTPVGRPREERQLGQGHTATSGSSCEALRKHLMSAYCVPGLLICGLSESAQLPGE